MRHLSYSTMTMYLECPLRYRFVKIDGLKPKKTCEMALGTSLHIALRFFYEGRKSPPELSELLSVYKKNWEGALFENTGQEKKYLECGMRILSDFHDIHAKNFKAPYAVEKKFEFIIEGVPVIGFIDRIDVLEHNNIEIIDYKSHEEDFTQDMALNDTQLTLYQIAVKESFGLDAKKLTLYHLRSQKGFSCGPRSSEEILLLKEKIRTVGNEIQKRNFEPRINSRCPCEFSVKCSLFGK